MDEYAFAAGCCALPVPVYVGSKWTCETCGQDNEERNKATSTKSWVVPPMATPTCECGASKTTNPNCHSHWCPASSA